MAERYYVLQANGTGWGVYSWSRELFRARCHAGRDGWVVRAGSKAQAVSAFREHAEAHRTATGAADGLGGDDVSIWKGYAP